MPAAGMCAAPAPRPIPPRSSPRAPCCGAVVSCSSSLTLLCGSSPLVADPPSLVSYSGDLAPITSHRRLTDLSDQNYTTSGPARRYRPTRRIAPSRETPPTLTSDFLGMAVAYGNTLLFIGYEVNGKVEVVVYPRYRFGSDDRVQGY